MDMYIYIITLENSLALSSGIVDVHSVWASRPRETHAYANQHVSIEMSIAVLPAMIKKKTGNHQNIH